MRLLCLTSKILTTASNVSGACYLLNHLDISTATTIFPGLVVSIDRSSTSINFVRRIELLTSGRRVLAGLTNHGEIVEENPQQLCNILAVCDQNWYAAILMSPHGPNFVFDLKNGIMSYCYTVRGEFSALYRAVQFPGLHWTFALKDVGACIRSTTARNRPVLHGVYTTRANGENNAVVSSTGVNNDERELCAESRSIAWHHSVVRCKSDGNFPVGISHISSSIKGWRFYRSDDCQSAEVR